MSDSGKEKLPKPKTIPKEGHHLPPPAGVRDSTLKQIAAEDHTGWHYCQLSKGQWS